jgi:hypothetical protein
MTMRQINFLVAAILGVFVVIFYLALGEVAPPSHIYPLTLIYLMAFLLLVMLAINLFIPGAAATEKPFAKTQRLKVLGVALASVIYVVSIQQLGFYFTSVIFLFLFAWILGGRSKKAKDILTSAGVSLLVMGLIYLGFDVFLKVPTPTGIFF